MNSRRLILGFMVVGLALVGLSDPAFAHAFKKRYDLPLPFSIFLWGSAAAVGVSFVVAALFRKTPNLSTLSYPFTNALGQKVLGGIGLVLQWTSPLVLGLLIGAAFWGPSAAENNFASVFVWIIWWVGLAFVSALIGNLWIVLNPWSQIVAGLERCSLVPETGFVPYPKALGAWPAVLLFFIFAWMELVGHVGAAPNFLGKLILIYSFITIAAMVLFGRKTWLENGECFAVFFSLFARFAPFAKADKTSQQGGILTVRLPASGLLKENYLAPSHLIFVILILASVTFDGVMVTPFWSSLMDDLLASPEVRQLLINLRTIGIAPAIGLKTVALLALPSGFLAVFLTTSWAISRLSSSEKSAVEIARHYVLSLIPIAIAYHLSHYLSYLLIDGQAIVKLASDPLGLGWDLFGTLHHRTNLAIIGAKVVWYFALCAIVIAHILAVFLAHNKALELEKTHAKALVSQIPMVVLMIGYTILSLWILAQPVVEA